MTSACKTVRWFATICCLASLVQFASGSLSINKYDTTETEPRGEVLSSASGSGREIDPMKEVGLYDYSV